MEGIDILAVVDHAHRPPHSQRIEFAQLKPAYTWSGQGWEPVTDFSAFPEHGRIFWHKPKPSANERSCWIFQVTAAREQESNAKRHHVWQVDSSTVRQPTELVSLPDLPDRNALRQTLSSGAIKLPLAPIGKVLISIPGDPSGWIGPLDKTESRTADPRLITPNVMEGFLDVRAVEPDQIHLVSFDTHSLRILGPNSAPAKTGYFNVQPSDKLLRDLVERPRKWKPTAIQALPAVRRQATDYAAALKAAELSPEERQRENARFQAAELSLEDFQRSLDLDEQLLSVVTSSIAALPAVHASLEERLGVERSRLESSMRTEIEQNLTGLRADEQVLRQVLSDLSTEAANAARGMIATWIPKLSEHQVIRQILGSTVDVGTKQPDSSLLSESSVQGISSKEDLAGAAKRRARSSRVDEKALRLGISLLAGSPCVLFAGPRATATALSVAATLSSGTACYVSVTTAMFGLVDLLKAPCAAIGNTSVVARSLGEFLQKAGVSDSICTVVLQGCNRCPPESVLLELLELRGGVGTTRLNWLDEREHPRSLTLDGRVLFVATLVDGSSTFPFAPSFSSRLPIIWTERGSTLSTEASGTDSDLPTCVSRENWRALANAQGLDDAPWLEAVSERMGWAESSDELRAYLSHAASLLGATPRAISEALAALCVGRVEATATKEISAQLPAADSFLEAVKLGSKTIKHILQGGSFS